MYKVITALHWDGLKEIQCNISGGLASIHTLSASLPHVRCSFSIMVSKNSKIKPGLYAIQQKTENITILG